jgi:hypothetical protein
MLEHISSPKLLSFVNGALMPLSGLKSMEKQIEIETSPTRKNGCTHCFALGHLSSVFPLTVALLIGMYEAVNYFQLYGLF